jgi:hypothetical protein
VDYSALLRRTWDIVWNHKWLIVLGILVALGGGSNANFSNSNYRFGGRDGNVQDGEFEFPQGGDFEIPQGELDDLREALPIFAGIGLAVLIPLICIGVLIGLALWVVSNISRGALVAGADVLDAGGTTDFSTSWRAGWEKGWRLIGIGLLPAIPWIVMAILLLGFGGAVFSFGNVTSGRFGTPGGTGLIATTIAVVCVAALAGLALNLLRTFAERACMLEDLDVFGSYGRGWAVLKENLGPAIIIFLIQVVIGFLIGMAMLVASPLLICLCLLIIPISLIVNGGVAAYFSTLWTLTWRRWTGRDVPGEPVMEAAPAV